MVTPADNELEGDSRVSKEQAAARRCSVNLDSGQNLGGLGGVGKERGGVGLVGSSPTACDGREAS